MVSPAGNRAHIPENPTGPIQRCTLGKHYVTTMPTVTVHSQMITVHYRVVSGLINKIFSATRVFFGYEPVYNSIKKVTIKTKPSEIPANVARIEKISFIVIGKNLQPKASMSDSKLTIVLPGPLVKATRPQMSEELAPITSVLQTPSPEREKEIQHFYDSCLAQPMYESLTRGDKKFLKTVLIPHLLAARDELVRKHDKNPHKGYIMTERNGPESLINLVHPTNAYLFIEKMLN